MDAKRQLEIIKADQSGCWTTKELAKIQSLQSSVKAFLICSRRS